MVSLLVLYRQAEIYMYGFSACLVQTSRETEKERQIFTFGYTVD